MSASLVTFSIILYILSLVFSLLILLINKTERRKTLRVLIVFHFSLFIAALIFQSEQRSYLFLLFFCSGIFLAGFSFKSSLLKPVKIYFSLFVFSFLLFLYSPSKLLGVITFNFNQVKEKEFRLKKNFYLMKQQGILSDENNTRHYKIFMKMGLFNRTLTRDIDFGMRVDSVRLLEWSADTLAVIRVFEINETNVKDSTELSVSFGMNKDKDVFLKHSK